MQAIAASVRRLALVSGLLLAPAGAILAAGVPPKPTPGSSVPAAKRGYELLARHCFKCHGEGSALSGLDLRTRAAALKGGAHGPAVVPGQATRSRLYRRIAGLEKPAMPPTGMLPEADVRAIQAWIDAGAPYPARAGRNASSGWWAFRPVRVPAVPAIRDPWVRNPIDAFVLQRLRAAGLRPNPPADRRTLIRRATFDLHGLPPTPEEVQAFVADPSPDAYERLIDRLLASPRYGERWARHWLDLARFAESEGFKSDETRPNAWRYRDYVIRSLNEDKPYDRFIREQIAGDELYPDDPEALVATGFNRHWADESNARNLRLRRQEILNDITDTTASVFLAMTLGCARCHDHKYDPITQKDYYRFQAFFAAVQPREDLPLVSRAELEEHQRRMAAWEAATRDVRQQLAALEAPYRARLLRSKRMPFPPEVQEAIDTPAEKRTALQWQLYLKVLPQIEIKDDEVGKAMQAGDRARWQALRAELDRFDSLKPPDLPTALGLTDVGPEAPRTYTLAVGVYDQPVEEVSPGFPQAIDPRPPRIVPPSHRPSTGRRSALALWLASDRNPLTARVMVNRVWQHHFGRGIVATSSDFGRTGELPTHPELLDWLAAYFMGKTADAEPGAAWRLKRLHRLIMTSNTYRQSAAFRPGAAAVDPENRLLWRYRRWRLEGEAIRDACLAISGELNLKMGGPSVFPELPEGVSTRGGWPVTRDEAERNRRSVYVFVRRNLRYPLFEAFDFPDTHEPCARRNVTNTAPQALMLFNSAEVLRFAQAMAGRLYREAGTTEARIDRAYRLAFGRPASEEERALAGEFLRRQAQLIRRRIEQGERVALPKGAPAGLDAAEGAALVDFCHALMNANEFLYVE